MQRYFAIEKYDDLLRLSDEDYHRIFNVLRLKKTETVEVVYGDQIYICYANLVNKVYFQYISSRKLVDNQYKLTFLLASSKLDKIELVIQKCTEICGANFILYNSERSVSIINKEKFENKKERLNKIIREASEQSKQDSIGVVSFCEDIKKFNFDEFDAKFIAFEHADVSKQLNFELLKNKNNILIVIGPEGGFSDKEVASFIERNFTEISLGKSILRCETAPIYTAAIISYLKGIKNE